MSIERAEPIADAVLYEGYVLYPYRASAAKNWIRWPFGVIAPRAWAERDGSENWPTQTERLIEPAGDMRLDLRVRWLRVQARTVEAAGPAGSFEPVGRLQVGGRELTSWEEGVATVTDLRGLRLADLLNGHHVSPLALEASREIETVYGDAGDVLGRVVRACGPLLAWVTVSAEPRGTLVKLRVFIENRTPVSDTASRETASCGALVAAHTIIAVDNGAFVSLLEPPIAARDAAATCVNKGTWPVLIGPVPARDVMLSSPIILDDYPAVADESPGELCDATEIEAALGASGTVSGSP